MIRESNNAVQKSGTQKPRFEVADVVLGFAEKHRKRFGTTYSQRRILEDVLFCRTIGMGGHTNRCDHCNEIETSYNSCRNRHCPKCQSLNKAKWLEDRRADLLPVGYLHSVFTIPHELNDLIYGNKKVLLNALFASVRHTFKVFCKDPKYKLVGKPGFTAVLHTWGDVFPLHQWETLGTRR